MNWFIGYAVVGLFAAAATSVVGDRFRANAGVAALLTAMLWPVVVLGIAQAAVWTLVVDLTRHASANHATPMLVGLELPPL